MLANKKPIRVKWLYRTKYKPDGEIDYFKARLIVKGYKQKPCIDYFEACALIARLDTSCMITSHFKLKIVGKYIKWMLNLLF